MSDKKKPPPGPDPDATISGPLRPPAPDPDPDATITKPLRPPSEPDPDATITKPLQRTEVDFDFDLDATVTGPLVPPKVAVADDPEATFSGPLTQFDPDATIGAGGRRRNPFKPKALPEALQANLAALGGLNPLIAFANPIFSAVPQIAAARNHPDPALLKETLQDLIEAFEAGASKSGASGDTVEGAVYALCCLADDAGASTPWGKDWTTHGLLHELRGEKDGGEEFFKLLAEKQQDPEENALLLEFFYVCLALGFQGRYRKADGGDAKSAELDRIRGDLHAVVSRRRPRPSSLSEKWLPSTAMPGAASARASGADIPWRMIAVPVSALLLLFIAYKLYRPEPAPTAPQVTTPAQVTAPVASAPSAAPAPPATTPAAPAPTPASPPAPTVTTHQTLEKDLATELKGSLLKLGEANGRTTITLLDDKQFASGAVDPDPAVKAMVERIAEVLERTQGPVLVRGYTDIVPVKPGTFASNIELSAARAKAVAAILAAKLTQPQRVTSEGMGEADQIAPNDTPENRAKNRRIQILAGPGK
jgi:type VI secretion system protein ImpK